MPVPTNNKIKVPPSDRAASRWLRDEVGRRALAALQVVALAAWLGGCANPDGIGPVAQVMTPQRVGLGAPPQPSGAVRIDAHWWRAFGDPGLDRLVDLALAGNPSLQQAQARIARAQAGVAATQAEAGARVNGQFGATRQRFSANGIYPPPLGGSTITQASAQASASWELDLFGRQRAALDAAVGVQRAAQAELALARVQLASRVARAYVQLGQLFAQRALAERALAQRGQMLDLITQRVRAGLDTTLEQRQGEGALAQSRLQIEPIDEQIMLVRHQLAALTAQAPDALDALSVPLGALRAVPLPDAVSIDLLGRRADIVAARWRVEAATNEVQTAQAQFYPNINLSAFVGLSSIGLDHLLRAGSAQYGAGPAISLPIFDAGRLRANLRLKTADLDAVIENYNATLLDAVRDAADQIGTLHAIARQQSEQAQALASAESAYALAQRRYRAGLGGLLVVLSAESDVLNQRRQSADLTARALTQQVALVSALGGGYVADPDNERSAQAQHAIAARQP